MLTDNIRKVTPYVPGEQPKVEGELIKLNTNEFPYPPAPSVQEAMDELQLDELRLYPNVTAAPLAQAIAEYHGFDEDEVFVGVGSDDVLANCFLTFFAGDKPILFPDVTYSFYDVWAKLYKIPFTYVPLDENFRIRKEDYMCENGGIVIANPNAPTGIAEGMDWIEDIVKNNPESVVIVDEAYVDFGGQSSLPLVRKYDNLVIVRTYSKSRAFAGMRIGYAISNKKLIGYLNAVKFSINSYTMNRTAITYGVASLKDDDYFKKTVQKVIDTREKYKKELEKIGFICLDSRSNFIFATHNSVKAVDIFEFLKTKNIYVRHFKAARIDNYLRITVGTDEQMERLVKALKELLDK